MSEVYVVTEGTYSDYRIRAVFTDKAAAEEFANIEAGQVETWEAFDALPKRLVWWVIDTLVAFDTPEGPSERSSVMWEHEYPAWNGKPYRYEKWGGHHRRVFGTDRERVRKVFWDNWHRERAEQEGIA